MASVEPKAETDPRYGAPGAVPPTWARVCEILDAAEVFWLSTTRPGGQPHVTPLLAVWRDDALHFCTGPAERKAANLATNPACALTTGRNLLSEGVDVVVEGSALPVRQDERLRTLADGWLAKYGEQWRFDVRDGAFFSERGGRALVFAVRPTTVRAFAKGAYSQTRWRLDGA